MSKPFQFRGKTYANVVEFMKQNNLEKSEFHRRLRNNEPLEQIVDEMGSKLQSYSEETLAGKIKVGSTKYRNLDKACLFLGVEKKHIEELVSGKGLSIQSAFEAVVAKEKIVVGGTEYPTLGDLALKYNITEKDLIEERLTKRSYDAVIAYRNGLASPKAYASAVVGDAKLLKDSLIGGHGALITVPTKKKADPGSVFDLDRREQTPVEELPLAVETTPLTGLNTPSDGSAISADIFTRDGSSDNPKQEQPQPQELQQPQQGSHLQLVEPQHRQAN